MVAQMKVVAAAAVQFDDDLLFIEIELRDLHAIAGIGGSAMGADDIVQFGGVERLVNAIDKRAVAALAAPQRPWRTRR